jgi:putative ABC transport system substrate-binding protein
MRHARRRRFLQAAGVLLIGPLGTRAQQPQQVRIIGYLVNGERYNSYDDAFVAGLRDHGYVEGQQVRVERRYGKGEALRNLATELVRNKVDVIVALGTPAAQAARQATRTIPIVMTLIADPVSARLVESLARPGGNVTGLSMQAPGVFGKSLQLLTQAAPGASRVALLLDPTNLGQVITSHDVERAARQLSIQLWPVQIRSNADLEAALQNVVRERADALYVFPLQIDRSAWGSLLKFAVERRLAMLSSFPELVKYGALMSYGISWSDQVRATGAFVDKILKGANPANLPVEQPTSFRLVVNMKTAKAIGLTIPQSVLLQADRVIE